MIVNVKSNGETECMIGLTELRGVVKGLPADGDLVEARTISMPNDGGAGFLMTFRAAVTITKSAVDVATGTATAVDVGTGLATP